MLKLMLYIKKKDDSFEEIPHGMDLPHTKDNYFIMLNSFDELESITRQLYQGHYFSKDVKAVYCELQSEVADDIHVLKEASFSEVKYKKLK